jgi:hypothetical protein
MNTLIANLVDLLEIAPGKSPQTKYWDFEGRTSPRDMQEKRTNLFPGYL